MDERSTWLGLMRQGQVEDLRAEAARAGDDGLVAICDDALEFDVAAQRKCLAVIADAEAQS